MRNQFVGGVPGAPFFLGSRAAFTPARLFANGEAGAWFDPSDLSTLFQDSAWTTPVTTAGDPVGLMLDKSQGLVLGDELVANGTFDTDLSGWDASRSDAGSSVTWSDGAMVLTGDAGVIARVSQLLPVEAGKTYVIEVEFSGLGSPALLFRIGSTPGGNDILYNVNAQTGHQSATFVAKATTYLSLYAGGVNASMTVDNISVRELPGNHASQATSNPRPTYQVDANGNAYLSFDGVDDYLRATLPATIYQPISYGAAVNFGDSAQFAIDGHSANSLSLASVSGVRIFSTDTGFSAPMSLGVNNVILSKGNGGSSAIRANGSETSGVIGAGAISAITLGSAGSLALPLNGRIYQAVILGGVFAGIERNLEAYLAKKSGVTL